MASPINLSTVPLSNTARVIFLSIHSISHPQRSQRIASWVKPTMSINKIVISGFRVQIQQQLRFAALFTNAVGKSALALTLLGKYSAPQPVVHLFKASRFRTSALIPGH